MAVDEQQISSLVSSVLARLQAEGVIGASKSVGAVKPTVPQPIAGSTHRAPAAGASSSSPLAAGGAQGGYSAGHHGVHDSLDSAIAAAKASQRQWVALPLAQRKLIIEGMRQIILDNLEGIARLGVEETGLCRFEDKINKNRLVATKTPGVEDLQPTAWTGDDGLTLMEWAPWGVIGAITPTTNPSETVICNGIGMAAAGNAVVFGPHPSAKRVTNLTVQLLNQAIAAGGGPSSLINSLAEPSIEASQALMKHPGIKLLAVTGGPGVVKAAMNSGKKVIAAGPGNPPAIVDETADIEQAARNIYQGASLDNNIVCIAEKEVIVVASVADALKAEMRRLGAVEVTGGQIDRLMQVIFNKLNGPGQESEINKKWVGKNASLILREIGIDAPDSCRLVICEVNRNHPLVWTEQLMPVLPIVRVRDFDEALDLAKECEHGYGHTSTIHSKHIDRMHRMACEMDTAIFVKNGPTFAGLGLGGEGPTSFTIAHPTGEGLTTARHFARLRRCVLKDTFRIV